MSLFAAFNTLEHRQKNSYAMHTIKLLLTYYLNISIQAANLSIAESNRIEKIDSVARIESNRNFFLPELECPTAATATATTIATTS